MITGKKYTVLIVLMIAMLAMGVIIIALFFQSRKNNIYVAVCKYHELSQNGADGKAAIARSFRDVDYFLTESFGSITFAHSVGEYLYIGDSNVSGSRIVVYINYSAHCCIVNGIMTYSEVGFDSSTALNMSNKRKSLEFMASRLEMNEIDMAIRMFADLYREDIDQRLGYNIRKNDFLFMRTIKQGLKSGKLPRIDDRSIGN